MRKVNLFFYFACLFLLLIGIFFDKSIVLFLAGLRNPFLAEIMVWFSFFGTWFVVLIVMTSLFLWQEHKRRWILPLWFSVGLSAIITYSLKFIIMRERPEVTLSLTEWSFPSGHATAVFSTLAVLDKEFPKFKWFWLCFAVLVAFSRLYLGAHYLTDVVAGALIGYTISLIVVKFAEKRK